jgi:CRP/FNR family cyclic AMP-dependent transcriptional regulator
MNTLLSAHTPLKRPPILVSAPHFKMRPLHAAPSIASPYAVALLPSLEWNDPYWLPCRTAEFFKGLPDHAISELVSLSALLCCQSNTVLFTEEQDPRAVFFLLNGRVKLSMNSVEGRRLILGIVGPGEILGLASTISGKPFDMTAETQSPSVLASIPRDRFLDLLLGYPIASHNVARLLSLENKRYCEQLRTIGLAWTAAARLARLLLEWSCEGFPTERGIRVLCPLTHEEIAEHIGVSRETVTRTLHGFRSRKLVVQHGAALFVSDRRGLEIHARVSFPAPSRCLTPAALLHPESWFSPLPHIPQPIPFPRAGSG